MTLKIYLSVALILFGFGKINAQNNSKDVAKTLDLVSNDSCYVVANKQAGWHFLTSYLTPARPDSVMIEMIVQHDRAIDWKQEQLVGRIKQASMFPKTSQTVSFMLMFDEYLLRVESNGRCYLQLAKGSTDGDPVIIPVRAKYKL